MRSIGLRMVALFCLALGVSQAYGKNIIYDSIKWKAGPNTIGKWKDNTNFVQAISQKTTLIIPEGHEKNRWVLEDDNGAGNWAVTVNGKKIGECTTPIVRFELGNLKAGTNEVELYIARQYHGLSIVNPQTNVYRNLLLNNKFNPNWPWGNHPMRVSGESRFVELSSPGDIRMAYAETSFRKKEIKITAKVSSTEDFKGKIVCTIRDWKTGEKAISFSESFAFKAGEHEVSFTESWKNPKLWDTWQPNLYKAELKLVKGGKEIDEMDFRFGFREIWVDGRNVMLNGHPFHARMDIFLPVNKKSLGFFRYIGRNAMYFQPHGNRWYGDHGQTPGMNKELLDLCDETGIVAFYPGVPVSFFYELLDKSLHQTYRENQKEWIDLFRNRPSIIAWGISMNAYNPRDGIVPQSIGRREQLRDPSDERYRKQVSEMYATDICREVDPTRMAYGHADGNIGSFGCGNCYPNMTPLQEVIEYPLAWSRDGDMPWAAVEYGFFDGSFYKENVMHLTELAAIYFGEKAYERETVGQLKKTMQFGLNARYYGHNMLDEVVKETNLYWDFMRLYTSETDKYWRSYGILAWNHFFWGRYGQNYVGGWNQVPVTVADQAPAWASPQVELNRMFMQDLLSYIGGDEVYSDKTHSFFEGETMRKNFVNVWDAANPTNVCITWRIMDYDGKAYTNGTHCVTVQPGIVKQIPIDFTLPKTGKRTEYTLFMTASNGTQTMSDRFEFQGFPVETNLIKPRTKTYLYDPLNRSAWVSTVVTNVQSFRMGTRLGPDEVLIIGREALNVNRPLPYTMEDINNGARVIILEQHPNIWTSYGFRLIDMVTRLVYTTPYAGWNTFMNGLSEKDLSYWRGTPNLLPEYVHARQVIQPPKGVNRHGVASTVFEIPNFVGAEPIFQCEFDLRYTPLLRVRGEKGGVVYFSSFDFTDRVGVDPAATKLAWNILNQVILQRQPKGTRDVVQRVDGTSEQWKSQILVNDGKVDPKTDEFLKAGGIVLNLALEDEELVKRGYTPRKKNLYRANLPKGLGNLGVTRNMLRWRDEMQVNVIGGDSWQGGEIWAQKGNEHFLQVAARMIDKRFDETEKGVEWVNVCKNKSNEITYLALDLLEARVLTALGAKTSKDVLERLNTIAIKQPYKILNSWYAYGPFLYTDTETVAAFKEVLPGEEQAISGDMNPNVLHHVDPSKKHYTAAKMDPETQSKVFDFRKMAVTDMDGCINLDETFNLQGKPSYCYLTHVWEEEEEGEGLFAFSFPAQAVIYLNGEEVFSARHFYYGPYPTPMPINTIKTRLKYREGENSITVKLNVMPGAWSKQPQRFSGTKINEKVKEADLLKKASSVKFYNEKGNLNHVYSYHFW